MPLYAHRVAVLELKSLVKFPSAPYLMASRTHNVRSILLWLAYVLDKMYFLEHVYEMFLDGLPPVNRWPVVRYDNRVLCVERGQGSGIAVDESSVEFFITRNKFLV